MSGVFILTQNSYSSSKPNIIVVIRMLDICCRKISKCLAYDKANIGSSHEHLKLTMSKRWLITCECHVQLEPQYLLVKHASHTCGDPVMFAAGKWMNVSLMMQLEEDFSCSSWRSSEARAGWWQWSVWRCGNNEFKWHSIKTQLMIYMYMYLHKHAWYFLCTWLF